jgi:hypothetical protein
LDLEGFLQAASHGVADECSPFDSYPKTRSIYATIFESKKKATIFGTKTIVAATLLLINLTLHLQSLAIATQR